MGKQVLFWLIIVTLMKSVMVLFVFATPLQAAAKFVFNIYPALRNSDVVKLWFVMIITPTVMNALQFWLFDNIFLDAFTNIKIRRGFFAHEETLAKNRQDIQQKDLEVTKLIEKQASAQMEQDRLRLEIQRLTRDNEHLKERLRVLERPGFFKRILGR